MARMFQEFPMWNFGQQIKNFQRSSFDHNDFIKKIAILGEL